VLGGMTAASTLAIFIVPVLFVVITRASYGKKQLAWLQEHHEELMEKAKKVESQDIDAELEYELQKSRGQNTQEDQDQQGDQNKHN
jgi:HAE1 family hydrophobic/amphiphilic exporter-1